MKNIILNDELLNLYSSQKEKLHFFPKNNDENFQHFPLSSLKDKEYYSQNTISYDIQELKEFVKPYHQPDYWDIVVFYNHQLVTELTSESLHPHFQMREPLDIQKNEFIDFFHQVHLLSSEEIHFSFEESYNKPIHFIFLTGKDSSISCPNLCITIKKQADVKILHSSFSLADQLHLNIPSIRIDMQEYSKLTWCNAVLESSYQQSLIYILIEQERNSVVNFNSLNWKGGVNRLFFQSRIMGEEANCNLQSGYITNEAQQLQIVTKIYHLVKNTYSNQLLKGILPYKSQFSVNSDVTVEKYATDVVAYQLSKATILHSQAQAFAKPQIHVSHDKLSCSHGATIGALDKEMLLYLQMRGLDTQKAKRAIVSSILYEVIDCIDEEAWRAFMLEVFQGVLNEF